MMDVIGAATVESEKMGAELERQDSVAGTDAGSFLRLAH
jgi:hypothetical protein